MTHPESVPLSTEELAKVRALFTRPVPPTDDPYAWRLWASNLTWIVPLYAARLLATLDAVQPVGEPMRLPDELRALSDAATAGPWTIDDYYHPIGGEMVRGDGGDSVVVDYSGRDPSEQDDNDAAYIAALVNWHRAVTGSQNEEDGQDG